ncbi:MAG TPA: MFS transporter [Stellaceae bacterium]|nr:MFS transporter [Stellaceae bacterium]
MRAWLGAFRVYGRPRLVAVLLMGFSSGLPLPLTLGTLSYWLAELGVSLTTIGLFTLVGLPYSFKFLWSPIMDRLPLPGVTTRLGRRRGWLLLVQALLGVAILALGLSDPRAAPAMTALAAFAVAFLSASQDIVIDAYRIELLLPQEQGAGAAATQWGYRFGLIAASAGALVAAEAHGWHFAYALMALLMSVGMATVWLTPEPRVASPALPRGGLGVLAWFEGAVVAPFADLLRRESWLLMLLFIVLYKFGDALAGVMSNPLYVALGFSKDEVAAISKVFGVIATLVGIAAGGIVVERLGLYRALLICGVLQMLANLAYAAQVEAGHDVGMLALTIGTENFTGGMGSAAFVAYLSRLCNVAFTATQYALLSSLASVGRTTLAASGGWLAERLDWVPFFGLATIACLPGLALLIWLMRRDNGEWVEIARRNEA